MRLITLSVSVLLCSSFIACSDDDNNDNDNLELSVDYLNQSAWTGQYIIKEKDGKTNETYTIGFSFTSKNSGSFTIFSNESEEFNISENMKYSVDKKSLIMTNEIGNAATILGDGWLVTEKDKNNMVLVRDLETEIYTRYLHLRRTN
jgi:hypothetical protein